MSKRIVMLLAGLTMCAFGAGAGEHPGEFTIPAVCPLTTAQLTRLRSLVKSDPEARELASREKRLALPLLGAKPHPLEVIHYEGLVNTDPRRIACVEKLREMGDVSHVMRYWQVSNDRRAGAMLRRFIAAWTSTYRLTGNDVNENKFRPLLVAYLALRSTFRADDRGRADAWVEALGKLHLKSVKKSRHFTNRYAKHVRLLALAGMILDRPKWIAESHEGIRRFVSGGLYADGTSLDLRRRDTLTYHMSGLRPVIELAMLAGEEGRRLYAWESPRGGSLKKSVDYVAPYAMGEKTREEWKNSKVRLDHERAKTGIDYYRQGRLFEPQSALRLMEEASYFDPELLHVVRHLTGSKAARFPTRQTLINEAARSRH